MPFVLPRSQIGFFPAPPGVGFGSFADRLLAYGPVAAWVAPSGAVMDLAGGTTGTWVEGAPLTGQPSLLLDDSIAGVGLDGRSVAAIPHKASFNSPSLSVLAICQRRTVASPVPWMSIACRDDQASGADQPGGWALSITHQAQPRWYCRDGQAVAAPILGPADVGDGDAVLIMGTVGPAGMRLFHGGDLVASAAAPTMAANLTSTVRLGSWRSLNAPFNGLLQLLAIFPSELDGAAAAELFAQLKSRVRHAAALAVSLEASGSAVVDPRPVALMATVNPTPTITVQPANASATVVGATIDIDADAGPSADDTGRYTLTDQHGPSAPAVLSVTVGEPSGGGGEPATVEELFLSPFNGNSAYRRPRGDGASLAAIDGLQTYVNLGRRLPFNHNNGFGVASVLATTGDPLVTVTWNGSLTGANLPVTNVRIPNGWPHYVPPPGEACVVVQPDGEIINFYQYNRDAKTAGIAWRGKYITELGHAVELGRREGTSASSMTPYTGALPHWRLTDATILSDEAIRFAIDYALHLVFPRLGGLDGSVVRGHQGAFLNRQFQYPAISTDGDAFTANNPAAPLKYGDALTFELAYDLAAQKSRIEAQAAAAGISNAQAIRATRMIAASIYQYCAYAVDGGNEILFRATGPIDFALAQAIFELLRRCVLPFLRRVTNAVSGATGVTTGQGVFTGSPGTPVSTTATGGGSPVAPNRALV